MDDDPKYCTDEFRDDEGGGAVAILVVALLLTACVFVGWVLR